MKTKSLVRWNDRDTTGTFDMPTSYHLRDTNQGLAMGTTLGVTARQNRPMFFFNRQERKEMLDASATALSLSPSHVTTTQDAQGVATSTRLAKCNHSRLDNRNVFNYRKKNSREMLTRCEGMEPLAAKAVSRVVRYDPLLP